MAATYAWTSFAGTARPTANRPALAPPGSPARYWNYPASEAPPARPAPNRAMPQRSRKRGPGGAACAHPGTELFAARHRPTIGTPAARHRTAVGCSGDGLIAGSAGSRTRKRTRREEGEGGLGVQKSPEQGLRARTTTAHFAMGAKLCREKCAIRKCLSRKTTAP